MTRNCSRQININLPLSNDIDYGHLDASEYLKTGMIVDNCGNPRIEFLPDPCVPLTGEETCEDNPLLTKIKGNVDVECNLTAGSIHVEELTGNGCHLNNTDDTKIIGFEYDSDTESILLIQKNSKICEGDDEPENEIFDLPIEEFVHNTTIEDFDFGIVDDNDDLLTIVDSDERMFTVDLSKYTNKDERYIKPGDYEATLDGMIELPYNTDTDEKVTIDISNAIHDIRDLTFDKCNGVLSITTKNEIVSIEGLQTNFLLKGEVESNMFSGSIRYVINNNIINVICDFSVHSPVGGINTLGYLPVKLEKPVYKWLVSMHGTLYSHLNHVQLTIATDGEIQLRQRQAPERVQDSMVFVFDSLNTDMIGDDYCK